VAFASVLRGLYEAFMGADADLAEINPLVITDGGELLALDAKIVLDDSALFRHTDLEAMRDLNEEEPSEIAAREAGINFIKLDGSIGCMVNGAGLAMTTMDLVKLAGGEPANFLDIGGGAKADRVAAAFRIILDDPNVQAILVNIFGGITRGDEVARGIVEARGRLQREVPMVVRIVGTNADEARPILAEANLITADSLDDAAAKAVAAARAAGASR
jgi:succinyl-CoA synthetase beta subunit